MRKIYLLIFLLSALIYSCTQHQKHKEKRNREVPVYKIGINLPLTGNGSYFAEEFRKGMDIVFDYIRDSVEQYHIEPIYDDNKLNPRDAVSITKKFIEIDQVDLIVSGYTPIILATIGLVEEAGIPMLASLSSAEQIAAKSRWVFRDFEIESEIMPLLASHAKNELELKKGSWLVINDDMGYDAVRFFSEQFLEEGGSMIEGEVFENTEVDLRNKIDKVLSKDPDFIIVIGRGSSMINALRQIRERDEDIPIISNNTVDNDKVWNALGEHTWNVWFPRPFANVSDSMYQVANKRFKSEHGEEMNWLNMYGLSIADYLVDILRKSKGDKELIRAGLQDLDVSSIRGRLVMNANRDVNVPHVVYTRRGTHSVAVK